MTKNQINPITEENAAIRLAGALGILEQKIPGFKVDVAFGDGLVIVDTNIVHGETDPVHHRGDTIAVVLKQGKAEIFSGDTPDGHWACNIDSPTFIPEMRERVRTAAGQYKICMRV